MPHKWNFQKINGLSEMQEAVLIIEDWMNTLIEGATAVLSFSDGWSFPERATERLQTAVVRANKLRSRGPRLVAGLIKKLEFKDYVGLFLAKPDCQCEGTGLRKASMINMNREIDKLIKLLKQARGICAAFELANAEIDAYLEPIIAEDDLRHADDNGMEEMDSDAGFPATDNLSSLFTAVCELDADSGHANREMRELIAALREVKTSQVVVSSNSAEK